MIKHPSSLPLVLGIWLGSTVVVLGVVGYSFAGIDHSLESNAKLLEQVQSASQPKYEIGDKVARRQLSIYVFAGEFNRAIFWGWNRAQIALAAIALLLALKRDTRASIVLILTLSSIIVLLLTFYMAPEITTLGRELDFRPRPGPDTGAAFIPADLSSRFERFDLFHRAYTALEFAKLIMLVVAAFLIGSTKHDRKAG